MQTLDVRWGTWALALVVGVELVPLTLLPSGRAEAQHHTPRPTAPVYISMEALHAAGGVPPGWAFSLPSAGDSAVGREVFTTMQCYTCHTVAGDTFPAYPPREVGPDLTGMGAHHPAAYFAESIINPNAVIITGEGYTGPDGRSRMPAYNDALTITQLLDLVAYLTSLRTPASHVHPTGSHTAPPAGAQPHGTREQGTPQHR